MSMPVFPDFKLLELGDRGAIEAFTLRFEPYSDLNFTSLWCWNTNDEVAWSVHEHNLVVRLPSYGGDGPPRFSQLGEHELAATVRHVLTEESVGNQLSLGPAVVAERLMVDDGFLVVEDRDNADYVIDIATFLARVGGSYEKVRQRIRRFAARASTVIDLDLGSQVHRDFVVHVASRWLDSHGSGDESIMKELVDESIAIERSVTLGQKLSGVGMILDDEPYGFRIYELLGSGWSIGHFAKTAWPLLGATDLELDAVLKRCFAAGATSYNEEQDLGLPGLRTAKQGHRPARLLRKFSIAPAG